MPLYIFIDVRSLWLKLSHSPFSEIAGIRGLIVWNLRAANRAGLPLSKLHVFHAHAIEATLAGHCAPIFLVNERTLSCYPHSKVVVDF